MREEGVHIPVWGGLQFFGCALQSNAMKEWTDGQTGGRTDGSSLYTVQMPTQMRISRGALFPQIIDNKLIHLIRMLRQETIEKNEDLDMEGKKGKRKSMVSRDHSSRMASASPFTIPMSQASLHAWDCWDIWFIGRLVCHSPWVGLHILTLFF